MSWITRYLKLVEHTEPPREFHLWCAIAGIGHVLGRKVWLNQWLYKIFPGQVMVLLVSESAIARKTTAMRSVGQFVEALPPQCRNIMPQRVSSATVLDALNRTYEGEKLDAIGLIVAEELGTFFSREHVRQDLPTLVTELNDAKEGEWQAPTRQYGDLVLMNPCLGMVAGTTPTGLAHEVPPQVRKTGFLGRNIIVHSNGAQEPEPLTEPPPQYDAQRAWLIRDIYRIASLVGEVQWSDDGKAWYEAWYRAHFSQAQNGNSNDAGSGWNGRKHVHLLRTAIILTCAERSELVLRVDMLEHAQNLLKDIERTMPRAMREVGVHTEAMERKTKLIEVLGKLGAKSTRGWVPTRLLFQYLWRVYAKEGSKGLKEDLYDFVKMGRVESRPMEKGGEEWKVVKTHGEKLKGVK